MAAVVIQNLFHILPLPFYAACKMILSWSVSEWGSTVLVLGSLAFQIHEEWHSMQNSNKWKGRSIYFGDESVV